MENKSKFQRNHKVKVLIAQFCLTLCDPIECSLPGSSVREIVQARIPPPRILPNPGIEPMSPALQTNSLLSESPDKIKMMYFVCILFTYEKLRKTEKEMEECIADC